jgi:hypothetical protein
MREDFLVLYNNTVFAAISGKYAISDSYSIKNYLIL